MERVKKIGLMLMLIAIFTIGTAALVGCNKEPTSESALEFSQGTPAAAPTITVSSLSSEFYLQIEASSFLSGEAKSYTSVSSTAVEDYIALYLASDSGWRLLINEPLTFYKSETLVIISYNEEEGMLVIVEVNLKSGSVEKLKARTDKPIYYYNVSNPSKTEYEWGEDLNLAGFSIVKTGSDGSQKTLVKDTDYSIDISSYNKNISGYYHLPFRLIGSTDLSGSISVRVKERDILQFSDGTATSFSQVYYNGIEGKLMVTPPSGVEDEGVSYRTKTTFGGEYGEWSTTEPSLTTVGEIFAEIKFSKEGYEDKTIHGLSIRITARPFDNADILDIADKTFDYDETPKSVAAEFDVPTGAKVEYQYGTGEWSETALSFTDAGRYEVWFRVTKDTYQTVSNVFVIWINKTEIPDVTAPSMVHVVAGEALDVELSGTEVGDVITYSTDNGANYVQDIPTVTSTQDIKVKVTRGGGYESVFTVKVVYAPDAEITGLTLKYLVSKVSDTDNYYLTLSSIQGGTWSDYYIIVRTSEDNGATWGDWIDVNSWYSENIPVYSEDGEYTYNFRLIGSSGYKDFEHTLTLPYRYLTELEVTTAPTQLNYMVGDTFNPAGIVVKKIYQDGFSENASPDEYEFIDFDNNIVTAATVLQKGMSQPIRVCIGDPTFMDSIKSDYESIRIHVYDTLDMSLGAAVLRVATLPSKTVYIAGEEFSINGIAVEVQVPTFGNRWIAIPNSRYGIKPSDAPDMTIGGKQIVKLTAKQYLTGTFIDAAYVEFEITINYPFATTAWYIINDQPDEPLLAYMIVRFIDNEKALLYEDEDPTVTTAATYTAVKNGGNYEISVFVQGIPHRSYIYSPTLDTMSGDLIKLGSRDVVLFFIVDTPMGDIPAIMVAVGGSLTELQIASFAAFGNFYLTDEATPEGLITPETEFAADTVIYCILELPDYSDAAFLGMYEKDGMLLIIDKNTIKLQGFSLYYTAAESEEDWTLTAMMGGYVYNKAVDTITVTMGLESVVFNRLDEAIYAIFTLVSEDDLLSEYCGQYIVEKGKPFAAIKVEHSQAIIMMFSDYNGEAIYDDTTATISAATRIYVGMLNSDYWFGKFGRYFVLDIYSLTVKMYEELIEYNGSFEIIDADDNYIYAAFTFDSFSFNAIISTDYPHSLSVASGDYAGVYAAGDAEFYIGLPFVAEFRAAGKTVSLNTDGYYYGEIDDEWMSGRFAVISSCETAYTLLFTPNEGGASFVCEYIRLENKLFYGAAELDGPAEYVGRFTYQGMSIEISSIGDIYGIVYGTITEAVIDGNQIVLTVDSWDESFTLIYCRTTQAINYSDITYTRYNPIYKGQPFTNYEFISEEYIRLTIDEEGNIMVDGAIVGCIVDLDVQSQIFTICYYNGITPSEPASYTPDSIVIGETTYFKQVESELPFEHAPFVGKQYANGYDILSIMSNGCVWLNDDYYANLLDFNQDSGVLMFMLCDESHSFGIYDYDNDSITLDGTEYTFIPYV